MARESKLQSEIRRHLKDKGCYVIKTQANARGSVPTGCPDLFFFKEGFWGALEIKADPTSPYEPLQEATLHKLDNWSWAKRVDPTTWPMIKQELEGIL